MSGLRQTLQRLWQVCHCTPPPAVSLFLPFPSDSPPPIGQDSLGLPADQAVDEEANFLLSGGDSLKALHLCEDILAAVGASSPELVGVLLDRSFADVLHHVACVTMAPPLENGPQTSPKGKKRLVDDPTAVPAKRECKPPSAADQTGKVVRRAGEVTDLKSGGGRGASGVFPGKAAGSGIKPSDLSFALRQSWSSDTGRCVDASPVLLVHAGTGRTTVFIGSHSHRFQALDLTSGSCLWERVLGDRVESSAAVSLCGSLVVVGQGCLFWVDLLLLPLYVTGLQKTRFLFVFILSPGCYDGCVYFLCTTSGKTQWTFQTGDAVKSCPAVDPITGLLIVGSHDGHVYALNPEVRAIHPKRIIFFICISKIAHKRRHLSNVDNLFFKKLF